jgi:peptidoglycan/LPS O-acetylase OafA/YrhL
MHNGPAGKTALSLDHKIRREDIQALRGYAVLLVVLYHSDLLALKSGFLGVDIFFVISGFLITGLISRSLDDGTFNLRLFYFRRAKRLLPAAYVTLAVTALLAPSFLTISQIKSFQEQVIGAVTFTANIVFWKQSGYFESGIYTKPLLHFWSLSVEEQYYLLIPWLLIALAAKRRLLMIATIIGASLIYCFTLANATPSAKFYFLFTRAWELGLGSIGALVSPLISRYMHTLFWPGVGALMIVPFLPSPGHAPGISALAICTATLAIILRRHEAAPPPVRLLAIVGDFSYSLYLVHWPIFVFVRSGYFGQQPPALVVALALALSLLLGYLLYRLVERPAHLANISPSWSATGAAVVCSVAIICLPPAISAATRPPVESARPGRLNQGLAGICDQAGMFAALRECRTSPHPEILVWGDSHAMHLLPGMKDAAGGVMQATRSACPPFLGIAHFLESSPVYTRDAARKCIEFNDSVLRALDAEPSVKVVALAAALSFYRASLSLMQRQEPGWLESSMSEDAVVAAVKQTVDRIRATGRKVVLVESPPYAGFNIGGCLERRAGGLWTFGKFSDCKFTLDDYERASAPEIHLLQEISSRADIDEVGFGKALCPGGVCEPLLDGKIVLYFDGAHLTYEGSEYLGKKMHLPDLLLAAAR